MKKVILLLVLFFSHWMCSQSIIKITRIVYTNDSVCSHVVTPKDSLLTASALMEEKTKQLLASLKKYYKQKTIKKRKYIFYEMYLSGDSAQMLFSQGPIQVIDNLIQFDFRVTGDKTFDLNWWYKKEEIQEIKVPSHH